MADEEVYVIDYDDEIYVTLVSDMSPASPLSPISATFIADGSVNNAEFQRLDGVTSNIQTQLDGKSNVGHRHLFTDLDGVAASAQIPNLDASKITTGTINVSRIPTNIPATSIADGSVDDAEFQRLNGVTSSIQSQLDTKASTIYVDAQDTSTLGAANTAAQGYAATAQTAAQNFATAADTVVASNASAALTSGLANLNASNIVTGILVAPRGGTGLSSYVIGDLLYASATNALSALAGNTTTTRQFLTSTGTGSAAQAPAWAALAASDIPAGIDAAKIGGGTISNAEFACLDGATSPLQEQLDTATAGAAAQFAAISVSLSGKANVGHTHAGADITSGTVSPARLGSGTANNSTFLRGDGSWNNTLAGGLTLGNSLNLGSSGTLDPNSYQVVGAGGGVQINAPTAGFVSILNQGINRLTANSTGLVSNGSFTLQTGILSLSAGNINLPSSNTSANTGFNCLHVNASGPRLNCASGSNAGVQVAGADRLVVNNAAVIPSVPVTMGAQYISFSPSSGSLDTSVPSICGGSTGLNFNAQTGASVRDQIAGTVVTNFGAAFGTAGANRFAIGPYAVAAASNTSPGIACDGNHLLHNVASGFAYYFSHAGNTTLHLPSGGPNFYTAAASDWTANAFSNNYYNTINFKTTAGAPGGATTQAYILSGPAGLYLAGYNTIFFRPGGTDAGQITVANGLTNINGIDFTTGNGLSEQSLKAFAMGGPNLGNISLRQLRSTSGVFAMAVASGSGVQSRVNSISIPGGSAYSYTGTGAQPTAVFGESFIPVDPSKCYSMRAWAQNLTNNPDVYIGLHCYSNSGASLGYVYCCASQVKPSSSGQWYQGYISGEGAPQTRFYAGTAYVRLVYLVGYGSPVGAWETRISPIEFIECPAQCGAFHNTTQSVANTTWTAALFNSEILDTSNLHDTATNTDRVNVPRTGKYRITAQAEFAGNATGYRQARVTVNGSALARSTKIVPNNGASLEAQSSIEIYAVLTAGDIVRLEAYQDSGGSLNLTSNTRLYLLWISD